MKTNNVTLILNNFNKEFTDKNDLFQLPFKFTVLTFLIVFTLISCGTDAIPERKVDVETANNNVDSSEAISKKSHFEDRFQFKHQFGNYLFNIKHNGYRDSLHINVIKANDSTTILRERIPLIEKVEDVYIRDLDHDGLLELYVITIDGNASFAYIEMYEMEGDSLQYGDLSKLYGPHKFSFTDQQLIHEHWLESANGCCDYLGIEFTYFELINNRFKLVKKSDFIHRKEEVVNRSSELENL